MKQTNDTRGPAGQTSGVVLRDDVRADDVETVREIVTSTGFFHPAETDVAVELVRERLARGPESGYFFVFAELGGRVVGYACYGPIACTLASYDLYWIVVHNDHRNRGLGRLLLEASEERIRQAGGSGVYVETSARDQYAPTRSFYEHCGYKVEAVLGDFYAPGDAKIIYVKRL